MKSFGNLTFGLLVILIASFTVGLEARRLALRPLTGRELRRALRESGFDEDSAAGRSVASALSGLSGFALGITKGIGGSLLFDVVTSNVTIDYITSLLNSTASSSTSSSSGTAQEICFKSRSADGEVINGRSNGFNDMDDGADPNGEWRQTGTGTGTGTDTDTGTITTPTETTPPTSDAVSNGLTCIVLSKEGSRRRRQLRIQPGTLRSVFPKSHRQTLKKYRRHRV
ncbi:uncharacterized protein LOC6735432 [Drosophila simulans]|uniref:GD11535 n=1 Tax=Drosophila simulans TaxID=7240 RepID=B4QF46_DROSI|nr:uncharacterized protein LOC6735432 [Drosophila simulans]EDX07957.1 GD11535 [Drosophila simulans]KMY95322.1 uncharacterized protein Dsimw501_GD11535 [Drosophila simulans]